MCARFGFDSFSITDIELCDRNAQGYPVIKKFTRNKNYLSRFLARDVINYLNKMDLLPSPSILSRFRWETACIDIIETRNQNRVHILYSKNYPFPSFYLLKFQKERCTVDIFIHHINYANRR